MMSTNLIGTLEAAILVFFVLYVASTIGVIVGVIWEGDRFPKETQQRGWRLLVGSLALDTLFTVLVFGTEGWVSTIQRNEIIGLEQRLAARSLGNKAEADITKRMTIFAGQTYEIIPYWDDDECMNFANELSKALNVALWQIDQPKSFTILAGVETGVLVYSDPGAPQRTKEAAQALVQALNDNGIVAKAKDEHPAPGQTSNKVSIDIGIKP